MPSKRQDLFRSASSIVIGYLSHRLPGGIVFYGNMTRSEEER